MSFRQTVVCLLFNGSSTRRKLTALLAVNTICSQASVCIPQESSGSHKSYTIESSMSAFGDFASSKRRNISGWQFAQQLDESLAASESRV